MKLHIYALFIIALTTSVALAQKHTISGTIKDAKNGESLIGAPVAVTELAGVGAAANVYGFYSLTLPSGKYTVSVSYVGYAVQTFPIDLTTDDVKLNIELSEKNTDLKEVVIQAEARDNNVKSMEMSVQKLDIKQINKIPALLGEVDVLRAIQLLPGVSTVGEGASGFNVRGGGVDQNLILLDEAPVFQSSHLFGFFSVFNPDAVKDVKLVKGGIPAQYGGRLSSLLDVRMKDGNNKEWSGSGGIGTIFSRFALEGPIVKNKGSFLIAGRRSYFDQLFFPFSKNEAINTAIAYFYDLTLKASYIITDKDRVYVSGYLGKDKFKFGGKQGFGFDWGNQTATVRYSHVFNPKIFSNVSLIYSNYNYSLGVGNDTSGFKWKSNIINYSIKPEFSYFLNSKNTITFGVNSTFYTFDPGLFTFQSSGSEPKTSFGDAKKYTIENSAYIGNEQMITGRFSAQYGLRASNWINIGPGTVYNYKDTVGNFKRDTLAVGGSTTYAKGEVQHSYFNLEPRLSVKYELNESSSLKASYNRMNQYLHLISNTTASTPLDVWTPATVNTKPQQADQYTLGYFKNLKDNTYETSVEVYYKDMRNQVDYVDGANLLLNKLLEGELVNGKGRAYGLEVYLKKSRGKFNGWISYTLARSERKVSTINNGNWYPNRYDKPHTLNVIANYDFNPKYTLSANFIYSSGTPATFPTTRATVQGLVIPNNTYNYRNNVRIPAYHRLDISFQITNSKKNARWYTIPGILAKVCKKPTYESNWVFSVYNVYNQQNPFSIYFQRSATNPSVTEAVRYSIIARPIPGITYNFKF
ncbi:MAG: TonB-dependent receptor [Bacteroidia bacterium]|nr:TonB-dependent receptor [Bacteroidia bacterium]